MIMISGHLIYYNINVYECNNMGYNEAMKCSAA